MPNPALLAEFETGQIDPDDFGHVAHVRVAWALVHAHGPLEAARRFEQGLRRISASLGVPQKLNITITYTFCFLIGERVAEQGATTWDDFCESNADLMAWPSPALQALYPGDLMTSDAARTGYLLPKPAIGAG